MSAAASRGAGPRRDRARPRASPRALRAARSRRRSGRAVAVLGPSGSGKTSLLEAIAGLRAARRGPHRDRRRASCSTRARGVRLPPERRRIGYVPQDACLFPHLDVARQRPLRPARPAGREGAFDEAVAILEIGGLLARYPATLSGGERQRVALARALATRAAPAAARRAARRRRRRAEGAHPALPAARPRRRSTSRSSTSRTTPARPRAVADGGAAASPRGASCSPARPSRRCEVMSQAAIRRRASTTSSRASLEADGSRGTGVLRVGEARLVVPTEDADPASALAVFAVAPEDILVSSRPPCASRRATSARAPSSRSRSARRAAGRASALRASSGTRSSPGRRRGSSSSRRAPGLDRGQDARLPAAAIRAGPRLGQPNLRRDSSVADTLPSSASIAARSSGSLTRRRTPSLCEATTSWMIERQPVVHLAARLMARRAVPQQNRTHRRDEHGIPRRLRRGELGRRGRGPGRGPRGLERSRPEGRPAGSRAARRPRSSS